MGYQQLGDFQTKKNPGSRSRLPRFKNSDLLLHTNGFKARFFDAGVFRVADAG